AARAYEELTLYALSEPRMKTVLDAERATERAGLTPRLPALLGGLGAGTGAGVDELVLLLSAALDGFVRALLLGGEVRRVRAAYDAFWLTLISAGQTGRR